MTEPEKTELMIFRTGLRVTKGMMLPKTRVYSIIERFDDALSMIIDNSYSSDDLMDAMDDTKLIMYDLVAKATK